MCIFAQIDDMMNDGLWKVKQRRQVYLVRHRMGKLGYIDGGQAGSQAGAGLENGKGIKYYRFNETRLIVQHDCGY